MTHRDRRSLVLAGQHRPEAVRAGVDNAPPQPLAPVRVTALFIALDGHLIMLEVLIESFYTLPINRNFSFVEGSLLPIVSSISWIFSSAMVIALPAMTTLLISNFAFGIMTRAAPQLNIFALGFPVAMLLGLCLIWLTLPSVAEATGELFDGAFMRLRSFINP